MLSQLCRTKPLLKFSIKSNKTNENSGSRRHLSTLSTSNTDATPSTDNTENCCLIEHCSFCNYRVCCLVNSCLNPEQQQAEPVINESISATENPAYGLSSKNWLECHQMEDQTSAPANNQQQDTRKDEDTSVTMNYVNISALASIPESRDENTSTKISQKLSQTDSKMGMIKSNYNDYLYSKPKQQESKGDTQKQDVMESSKTYDIPCDNARGRYNENMTSKVMNAQQKHPSVDKAVAVSVMKSHLNSNERRHQEPLQVPQSKLKSETNRFRKFPTKEKYLFNSTKWSRGSIDNFKQANSLLGYDRLSEMTTVNTEESIQEWLMRISEWVDSNSWIKDGYDDTNDSISRELEDSSYEKDKSLNDGSDMPYSESRPHVLQRSSIEDSKQSEFHQTSSEETTATTNDILNKASKDNPANIPMVVMQCSRLHSHIANKPPFQQTSLPMGTLVTALYQESDWLYIQTPHGVEGFISSSNCAPIGTMQSSNESKRPWEPCDFPIPIRINNTSGFARQQGSFVPAKLPSCGGKRMGPCINLVKMKTNFYSDRHFNYTFKPKDSIKTAKTVTDILKSSPEIEINT